MIRTNFNKTDSAKQRVYEEIAFTNDITIRYTITRCIKLLVIT